MITSIGSSHGQQRIGAIGGALDMFMPQFGGMFSALSGIVGLFGKHHTVTVDRVIEPIKQLPAELSIFSAASPESRLFTQNMALIGAAWGIDINLKNGAEDILEAKVASRVLGDMMR